MWSIAVLKGSNTARAFLSEFCDQFQIPAWNKTVLVDFFQAALGYDEGTVVIKLGSEARSSAAGLPRLMGFCMSPCRSESLAAGTRCVHALGQDHLGRAGAQLSEDQCLAKEL